jgi:hypothetical protein
MPLLEGPRRPFFKAPAYEALRLWLLSQRPKGLVGLSKRGLLAERGARWRFSCFCCCWRESRCYANQEILSNKAPSFQTPSRGTRGASNEREQGLDGVGTKPSRREAIEGVKKRGERRNNLYSPFTLP